MENMDIGDETGEFIFHQGKKRIYDVRIQHISEDKKRYIEYGEDEMNKWRTTDTITTNKDLSLQELCKRCPDCRRNIISSEMSNILIEEIENNIIYLTSIIGKNRMQTMLGNFK